jgi:hypothetical protein
MRDCTTYSADADFGLPCCTIELIAKTFVVIERVENDNPVEGQGTLNCSQEGASSRFFGAAFWMSVSAKFIWIERAEYTTIICRPFNAKGIIRYHLHTRAGAFI